MAINFSASFAACIAAGLKVPRQIMYCITQDTGQPYVLYKDSQEAERNAAAISGTATQWGSEMYPGLQQQAHLSAQQQQQQQQQAQNGNGTASQLSSGAQQSGTSQQPQSPNRDPNVRENAADSGAGTGAPGGGVRQQGSPSTSPYPSQQQQQQQQRGNTNGSGGPEDDVAMNQVYIIAYNELY